MTTRVRILWLLVLGALLGGGNVCAQDGLGQIIYDNQATATASAGGALEFYNNARCKDSYDDGLHQFPARENVPAEWLDAERTVYIKATPNAGHKLGAADAETHAVTFITATETVAMSGGNNARTRNDGDAITVTLVRTDGQAGIYKFQMPADGSDVTVTAAFPEHTVAKLGDAGYEHINYIDYETDAQTGTLTAVTRSTEDLTVPVYVLDGTETTLGTAGTSESPTEAWYVCLTPPTEANDNKGLVYGSNGDTYGLRLANYCHVHLILADGSMMTVGGEKFSYGIGGISLTIYGQGGTDNAGQSAEGVLNVTGRIDAMDFYGDLTINGGQLNAACSDNKAINVDGGDIAIHGGIVNVSSNVSYSILAYGGDIAITGGSVISTGNSIQSREVGGSGGHLTISGGMVNFSREAIECSNSLTISGGQVEAYEIASGDDLTISSGVVKLTSDGYGIHSRESDVVISGGQVEASTINAKKDITLGWTAASDYIKAGSFTATSGVVKTKAGCRFVALDESAGEGLPTAKAIVPADATAGGGFELSDIEGQTLRPVDGYLLGLCPGLGVFRNGSAAPALEFTMTEGGTATHYYIYKSGDNIYLKLDYSIDGKDYNEPGNPVEILQENPTDPTALPTRYEGFIENEHTMKMPGEDLKIAAYRVYRKNVEYLGDGSAKNSSSVEKAYILDGHDHTLYGGKDDDVWYVLLATADETKGWMKDSEGNLMLTADGNMFECLGDVNIILADGSALCVGSDENRFTGGGAVIKSDGILKFYTQSVPKQEKDADGHVTHTDNRGRMEIYTNGADAIRAAGDITLSNVRLKAKGEPAASQTDSPSDVGLVYTEGALNLIGGQISVADATYAFYSKSHTYLDWMLTTDEIYGSHYKGNVTYADGKKFVDKESPSMTFPADPSESRTPDGFTLVGAVDLHSASTNPMVITNFFDSFVIVQPEGGPRLVSAMLTNVSNSGEAQFSLVKGDVNGQTVDGSGIVASSNVTIEEGGTLRPTWVVQEDALTSADDFGNSKLAGGSWPDELRLSGMGADRDRQDLSAGAGRILAEQSLQTVAAGDGETSAKDIVNSSVACEITRQANRLASAGPASNNAREKLAEMGVQVAPDASAQDAASELKASAQSVARFMTGQVSPVAKPVTLNFTVNGTASPRNLYLCHYVDGAWKMEGSKEGPTVTVTIDKLSRRRAPGAEQPRSSFMPMDYDPDEVLAKGEVVLFMMQTELLSIAIYQREHPEEVKKARARGALMIDTTTPETTAIIGRLMVTERAQPGDEYWYSLDGRRLPSAPTAKGVYVHRGRKVVIR